MWTMILIALGASTAAVMMGPGRGRGGGAGGQRGGMMGGFGLGMLLRNESVQDELGLSDGQRDKLRQTLQEVRGRYRGQLQDLRQLNPPEARRKGQEVVKAISDALRDPLAQVLDVGQQKRLGEIERQYLGGDLFSDAAVQAALNLTEEQKAQFQVIVESTRREMRGQVGGGQQGGSGDGGGQMLALRRQITLKAAAALTAEQQQTLQGLLGKPFEIKVKPRPGGQGGRGPRGGGGRGRRDGGGVADNSFMLESDEDL